MTHPVVHHLEPIGNALGDRSRAAGLPSATYTALIRTRNSAATLPTTLASLSRQTVPPCTCVIVDSGSTDGTLALVPQGSAAHRFVGKRFNYADALNQGLNHVGTDYVLIVSSHTSLSNPRAVEYALGLLCEEPALGAAYFTYTDDAPLRFARIDALNFDGFNGLSNTCALVRSDLLRRRPFRPEVFAAEDQEWAGWLFRSEKRWIAQIGGGGLTNINRLRYSVNKWFKEYIAVALYANRELLGRKNLLRLISEAVRPALPLRPRRRVMLLALVVVLQACSMTARLRVSNHRATMLES